MTWRKNTPGRVTAHAKVLRREQAWHAPRKSEGTSVNRAGERGERRNLKVTQDRLVGPEAHEEDFISSFQGGGSHWRILSRGVA